MASGMNFRRNGSGGLTARHVRAARRMGIRPCGHVREPKGTRRQGSRMRLRYACAPMPTSKQLILLLESSRQPRDFLLEKAWS